MQNPVTRALSLSKWLIESGFVWNFPNGAYGREEMKTGHGLGKQNKVQTGMPR